MATLLTLIYILLNISHANMNKKDNIVLNGIYKIESIYNFQSIHINKNNILDLFSKQSNFKVINIKESYYFIETFFSRKRLGVENGSLKIFTSNEYNIKENMDKIIWNLIHINQSRYIIVNNSTNNLIEFDFINERLQCINKIDINNINYQKSKINYIFNFIKLVGIYEFNKEKLNFVKKEPIDILIKYIDLTDKKLNREGINQIYKDIDNEELKYSIRSILYYIPWIRKIFILMPNEKVKYLKELEIIEDKIKYINDKEMLGYDTANIHAFTFQLFKLEKFGLSKNFIYMEDDFFIGSFIKKSNFFYYEPKYKDVFPFLIQKYFYTINETELNLTINDFMSIIEQIHPHSSKGWFLSIYNTELFFLNKYKDIKPIVSTFFTHCARGENTEYMKEIFHDIQNYSFINETLYSKERPLFCLNQPQYNYLFKLNIKKNYNSFIKYAYYKVEYLNKYNLNIPLFVINTGGNHEPFFRQNILQKKIMEKRYSFKTIYEILSNKNNNKLITIIFFLMFKTLIIFILIKIIFK